MRAVMIRSVSFVVLVLFMVTVLPGNVSPARADQARELQYWLQDYGIQEAWQITRGAGVTVSVIDSGVDKNHPTLTGAVIGGKDFSGVGNADGTEPVGTSPEHGTLVASILAGRGEAENTGLIGVAPEANILAASVGFGLGSNVDEQIADAIIWSVDQGADIINLSLTRNSPDWPLSWDEAFQYAFDNDVLVIAAAGNRGAGTTMVGAPATIPGVLTVAGVDQEKIASFDSSTQGITLAVSAPSEDLVGAFPGGGYVLWSGTSGAAPIVSGVAALVRSAFPNATASQVIARLMETATYVGDPLLYGNGLVNAEAALKMSGPVQLAQEPSAQLAEWIRIHRRAFELETPSPSVIDGPILQPIEYQTIQEVDFWDEFFDPVHMRAEVIPRIVFSVFGVLFIVIVISGLVHFIRRQDSR